MPPQPLSPAYLDNGVPAVLVEGLAEQHVVDQRVVEDPGLLGDIRQAATQRNTPLGPLHLWSPETSV
jgi:hypothetical protein